MFYSVGCKACCLGHDPLFEDKPSFEFIGSSAINISWDGIERNMVCADKFDVLYWETGRFLSTKLVKTLRGYNVRGAIIHVREGVDYSFKVNAIEEGIGECNACKWMCEIGGGVCCVGNDWSGIVRAPVPTAGISIDSVSFNVACNIMQYIVFLFNSTKNDIL